MEVGGNMLIVLIHGDAINPTIGVEGLEEEPARRLVAQADGGMGFGILQEAE